MQNIFYFDQNFHSKVENAKIIQERARGGWVNSVSKYGRYLSIEN